MPKTFDDYAIDLEKLLEQAREAILADAEPRMKASHRDLTAFIAETDDRIEGIIELDNVAAQSMRDLTLARLDKSLVKNLSERSADIARLVRTISNQSSTNNSAAAVLRLERVKAVLESGTNTVNELKKLSDTLDTSTAEGKKLDKTLETAINAVLAVQKQIIT